MTDDERAAWMTPPPDLVRGCDSPEGVRILADWLDEHGGDGAEFRELQRGGAEWPLSGCGYGDGDDGQGEGYGSRNGDGTGYGLGPWDDKDLGDGAGGGYGAVDGTGDGYGDCYGDGGPELTG